MVVKVSIECHQSLLFSYLVATLVNFTPTPSFHKRPREEVTCPTTVPWLISSRAAVRAQGSWLLAPGPVLFPGCVHDYPESVRPLRVRQAFRMGLRDVCVVGSGANDLSCQGFGREKTSLSRALPHCNVQDRIQKT